MRRSFAATLALAAALVVAPQTVSAQEATFGEQAGWTEADENRSTIMRFLERPEVGGAAAQMGVDVQDVGRGVLRMSDADAARIADRVQDVEDQLAADTITITTTTIIIILLVLILLVLIL